jgi:hypothetical protein
VCDAVVAARDPHFLKDLGIARHRLCSCGRRRSFITLKM